MLQRPRRDKKQVAAIDMAPLIDMTFLLLIFFLLNTQFVKDSGVEVNLPKAASGTPKKDTTLRVAITASGTIHIDKRQVALGAVATQVARHKRQQPKAGVIITADAAVRTGLLVKVIDQVKLSGIDTINIATSQEE